MLYGRKEKKRGNGKENIKNLVSAVSSKISEAVAFGLTASVYDAKFAQTELNTAQTIVLSLFYGLLFGDEDFCSVLLELPTPQMRSTYQAIWLCDDFQFNAQDVEKVLSMLSFLEEMGRLNFPDHVVKIFWGLMHKYQRADCCSERLKNLFEDSFLMVKTSKEMVRIYFFFF